MKDPTLCIDFLWITIGILNAFTPVSTRFHIFQNSFSFFFHLRHFLDFWVVLTDAKTAVIRTGIFSIPQCYFETFFLRDESWLLIGNIFYQTEFLLVDFKICTTAATKPHLKRNPLMNDEAKIHSTPKVIRIDLSNLAIWWHERAREKYAAF